MNNNQAQVGSVGFFIDIQFLKRDSTDPTGKTLIPRDISGLSTVEIRAKPPVGALKTFAATFLTTGVDGWIRYETTDAADLDEGGMWEIQGFGSNGTDLFVYTSKGLFPVEDNL